MFPISRFFETIRMNIRANWLSRHSFQSEHWAQYLTEYDNKNPDVFGFEWGDPEDTNDRHGNYKMILDLLNNTLNEKDVVLEIGALGGKWTKYLLKAKKIIAVDVNDVFIEHINKRFPEAKNIEFYVSKGDELNGIKDDTVNLVFSMDTFTRVKKKYIKSYFREINRVLVRGGWLLSIYQMLICRYQGVEALQH